MNPQPSTDSDAAAGAPRVLEVWIQRAEAAKASDIHFQMRGRSAEIAFRLDGVLVPAGTLGESIAERLMGRIKYLARLATYQDVLPQDGRIEKESVGSNHDIRVATYPTITGEKIVLRLFAESLGLQLSDLGLPSGSEVIRELQSCLASPSGLILLTGPAGSGKTTTIYAALRHLSAQGGRHIVTIEDPVEQVLPALMQTEVNEPLGLTFAKAARHLIRQDPQVLVVGEIRDPETADLVVRAALTGHLVISTLHAGSCRGVIERIRSLCSDAQGAVAALTFILNQRLVRTLCGSCQGEGCGPCLNSGYQGRVPVMEWIRIDEALRTALRSQTFHDLAPPKSLAQSIAQMVASGVTNLREQQRVLGS